MAIGAECHCVLGNVCTAVGESMDMVNLQVAVAIRFLKRRDLAAQFTPTGSVLENPLSDSRVATNHRYFLLDTRRLSHALRRAGEELEGVGRIFEFVSVKDLVLGGAEQSDDTSANALTVLGICVPNIAGTESVFLLLGTLNY